jgi:hypothetical protein
MDMAQGDREIGRFGEWTEAIIGGLIQVHRSLGPLLPESAYEACLCAELSLRGVRFERLQAPLPVGLLVNFNVVALKSGLRRLTP